MIDLDPSSSYQWRVLEHEDALEDCGAQWDAQLMATNYKDYNNNLGVWVKLARVFTMFILRFTYKKLKVRGVVKSLQRQKRGNKPSEES
ncbi:hypothetical protein AgCh_012519 [Apium graveolens]